MSPLRRHFPALLVGGAALVPRLMTVGNFMTTDEALWLGRTRDFSEGLVSLDAARMTATQDDLATMPGVTTMWLGSIGRGLWALADGLGRREGSGAFDRSPGALAATQWMIALATSLLIALFVVVARRWCGLVPAVVAGVLLATEPFVVAHGAVLHTDELTMLFGINGVLLAVLALGVPRPVHRPRVVAVAAGVSLACAGLTKASAAALLPGLVVVLVVVTIRRRSMPGSVRTTAELVGVAALSGGAVFILLWPALWVDPVEQVRLLWRSASQAGQGGRTFFEGRVTTTGDWRYYLVATPLRITPWFLAGLAAVPFAWARRTRAHVVVLVAVGLPAFVVISTSAKLYDRYVLIVVPHLALAVGLGVAAIWRRLAERHEHRVRSVRAATAGLGAVAVLNSLAVAPFGLLYFNPLLGGSERAERTLLVGWGEGLDMAGQFIADRQKGDCDIGIDVRGPRLTSMYTCISGDADADPTYRVLYINERQRLRSRLLAEARVGTLVAIVRIRGFDVAEVYDLRPDAPTDVTILSAG